MESLTIENFTRYYLFHPYSDRLSQQDQTTAWIATAALALFTFCSFFYARNFTALPQHPQLLHSPGHQPIDTVKLTSFGCLRNQRERSWD